MLVHFGTQALRAGWESAVVCIGTFDGVHLGHQEVVRTAISKARSAGAPCVLATFDRHPASVVAPHRAPRSVSSLGQNLDVFSSLGVDACIILAFDEAMAAMPAQAFLDGILRGSLRAKTVVVGHDFAMGHGREGDTAWLSSRIDTVVVPAFQVDGHRVSSSEVRSSVQEGDVARARTLLGRPFTLRGVVVRGQQLGREIGFPTANIALSSEVVVPGDGVYACSCKTPFGFYRAATNVGVRPAVGGGPRTIEAYLVDYGGESLYGRSVDLSFFERLRDEEDFQDMDSLKCQIAEDVRRVAAIEYATD
ncbi:MAG TPA: riboflavin biosynthesis protein RibF [Fimbriimonadaceae bacterium]|nr:riboflavin biosynthesis protein RibF [Fimbriimonadaceae bacterium]